MAGELIFTAAELADMQATQSGHMMDTCLIQVFAAGSVNAWNVPASGYTNGSAIFCGYEAVSGDEMQGETEVVEIDGRFRLPFGTAVKPTDRIKLTHRHGVAVTAEYYEIVGQARRGPSGLVVDVVRVKDGTGSG